MYLPQDEKDWTKLSEHDSVLAIRSLNDHLKSTPNDYHKSTLNDYLKPAISNHTKKKRGLLKSSDTKPPEREGHTALQVEWVNTRPLPFYGDGWLLYLFGCVINGIPELAGYERIAYLFAVRSPVKPVDDTSDDPYDIYEWTLLDWTSSPLHQLNEMTNLNISQLNPEHAKAYLVFYSSFLGGGEDVDYALTPLLIPRSSEDFNWKYALPPLAELARKKDLATIEFLADIEFPDNPDLPPSDDSTKTTAKSASENDSSFDTIRRAISEAFFSANECNQNPPLPLIRAVKEDDGEQEEKDNKTALIFEGVLVWYRNMLFRMNFSVSTNGGVSVVSHTLVARADELSLPRFDVRQARPPVPVLCLEKPRDEIFAEEFLVRIRQSVAASDESRAQQLRLRGLRVHGDVKDSGVFDGAIRLENVEFVGSVRFDDAVFERSLKLISCRFLQRLSVRNTIVKGAFRLDRSHCLGALDISFGTGPLRPTLDLRGLEAKGGLFVDNLTVSGRMCAQWARIGGAMRARGLQLQVHDRGQIHGQDRNADNTPAIDFSHMTIDGPLDLVGSVPRRGVFGESRRTFIDGVARMHGLRASQVDLRGIRVEAKLDLESCEVSGIVDLGILEFDDNSGDSWRARVGADLILTRGNAGLVGLSGCAVGMSLMLAELRLTRSLYARLYKCFRTRIGGGVTLSGAIIQGDVDFEGALIAHSFSFITGRCGRLKLGAKPWQHRSTGKLGICQTSAKDVVLMDLHIDAGIDVAGLLTDQPSGERKSDACLGGSFVALGTRLGGGIRFWREDASAYYRLRFAGINPELAPEVIDHALNGICARIGGRLDLRGIHTTGSINLGRCKVGDIILLDNARVGGNLRACFENTLTCSAAEFKADHARIEGNADLSGLEVRGDLSACDSRVDGNLRLPTGLSGKQSDRCAKVRGAVRLAGLRVDAILSINRCGLVPNKNKNRVALIDLSRCQIGQLKFLKFEGKPGTPYLFDQFFNLVAIQVGDWYFQDNSNKQARALLAKTEPFDACNYIDIEHRLARIGYKGLADRVYIDMKKRAYHEMKARQDTPGHKTKWLWLKQQWLWLKHYADLRFSRHGTRPRLMAIWLILSALPVAYVLSDYQNVEFALVESTEEQEENVEFALVGSTDEQWEDVNFALLVGSTNEQGEKGTPISDNRPYKLKKDWGLGKAFGLAFSYAIPFYGGAKSEVVRARLNGPIYAPWPVRKQVSIPLLSKVSPHGFAMFVSLIQFFLWIYIAANLPTIIRRRS